MVKVETGRGNWRTVAVVAAVVAMVGADSLVARARARDTEPILRSVQQPVRILLVRHGETTPDGTRDPALSADGVARGKALAQMLASAGVTQVYTTDYKRTRGIAEAVAQSAGVAVEQYDPTALGDFAAKLETASGVIVVVGHSNTTPELVQALGGEPGSPIAESEYDRLYVVVPARDGGEAATVLLRYGG